MNTTDQKLGLSILEQKDEVLEKLILPRYPLCHMTLKPDGFSHALEVRDISLKGFQLKSLEPINTKFKHFEEFKGLLHWYGSELDIKGKIRWISTHRLGVEFDSLIEDKLKSFLHPLNVSRNMKLLRPIPQVLSFPKGLRTWLCSDGPNEIFIWESPLGEIEKIQWLSFNHYVQWSTESGLCTGILQYKREIDTPLLMEDEIIMKLDEEVDSSKMGYFLNLLELLSVSLLKTEDKTFLKNSLSSF